MCYFSCSASSLGCPNKSNTRKKQQLHPSSGHTVRSANPNTNSARHVLCAGSQNTANGRQLETQKTISFIFSLYTHTCNEALIPPWILPEWCMRVESEQGGKKKRNGGIFVFRRYLNVWLWHNVILPLRRHKKKKDCWRDKVRGSSAFSSWTEIQNDRS